MGFFKKIINKLVTIEKEEYENSTITSYNTIFGEFRIRKQKKVGNNINKKHHINDFKNMNFDEVFDSFFGKKGKKMKNDE